MDDLISRQAAIDAIMSEPPDAHYPSWYADILWKLPSACNETKQQATKVSDCISRQKVIDALSQYPFEKVINCISIIEELPSAQPERPFEIQDILNYLDTVLHPIISPEHWNVYSELHDMISTLPSAEPRKKGKWLLIDAGYYDYVKCSQCGETLVWGKNFCPNCGADMREGEQE